MIQRVMKLVMRSMPPVVVPLKKYPKIKQYQFTCEYKGKKYEDSSQLSISTYHIDYRRIRSAYEIAKSCIDNACKALDCSKSELENIQFKLYEK